MTPEGVEGSESSFEADDFMPSEEKCFEVLRDLRWSDGVYCPRCGSERTAEHGEAQKITARGIGVRIVKELLTI